MIHREPADFSLRYAVWRYGSLLSETCILYLVIGIDMLVRYLCGVLGNIYGMVAATWRIKYLAQILGFGEINPPLSCTVFILGGFGFKAWV